jgi:plastocyanin
MLTLAACGGATGDEVAGSDVEAVAEMDDHHEDDKPAHEEAAHDDDHGDAGDHHEGIVAGAEPFEGAEEIHIVATDFAFEPATIHLTAGVPVNFVLENQGQIEHEVQMLDGAFHLHTQPGEMATGGFVPEETGEFDFNCLIEGHLEAGMVGEVHIEA